MADAAAESLGGNVTHEPAWWGITSLHIDPRQSWEWFVKRLPQCDDPERVITTSVPTSWHVRLTIPGHRPNAGRIFAQTPAEALTHMGPILAVWGEEHLKDCSGCESPKQIFQKMVDASA